MAKKSRPTKYTGIKRIGVKEYEVRIRWKDPHTGKPRDQKRICKGTVEDARELQLKLQEEATKTDEERQSSEQHRMTLEECGRLWFKQHVVGLKPISIERYRDHLKRITAFLGHHYVDALTPMNVQALQAHELESEYARATIGGCVAVLRQISRFAVANRIITFDFTAGITTKGYKKRYTVDEPNSLTVEQLRAFLAYAKEHEPAFYVPLFVMACTGLRVGELLGLKWDDVDVGGKHIMIRRTNSRGYIGDPKTHAGRRRVAMPDGLCDVLQTYRASLVAEQHPGLHKGWVFPQANGSHFRSNPLNIPVRRIAQEIGLPFRFTPHGLRRTFNSMLRHTAPDRVVMDTLGHADIAMTAHYTTIYDHEKLAASTNVLELVVGSKREDSWESNSVCPTCGQKIINDSSKLTKDASEPQ